MKRRDAIETKPTQLSKDSIVRAKTQNGPAFLFDLDGTSADSVYQHVLAWREALEKAGIDLAV
jgi:hypothetical protein